MPLRMRPVLIGVLILSACGTGSSSTPEAEESALVPGPTGSESESSPPSPSATAEATPTPGASVPGALAPDGIAAVVTDDLVVRSLPEISAQSVIDPIRLSEGKLLFVLDGPVAADGYDWYQVAPFDEFPSDTPAKAPQWGWVAAGREDEAWIAPWIGDCPEATLEAIFTRPSFLELACFGDRNLTLEGILADCSYTVPGYISPEWLVHWGCELQPYDFPSEGLFGGLWFHQESETPEAIVGQRGSVRVVGHFDDPAAQTCTQTALLGDDPMPPEMVVLSCRIQFVATEVTELDGG